MTRGEGYTKAISASRGAAVLGMSQYKTTFSVWLEIMEQLKPGFCESRGFQKPLRVDSPVFRWGHAFEDPIIRLAERVSGEAIHEQEKFYSIDDLNVTCHIDGRYGNTFRLHEGKTSNSQAFRNSYGKPGSDRVPTYIQVQVQHQMGVTSAEEVVVSVLVFPETQDKLDQLVVLEEIDPKNWADILFEMGMFHQYFVPRDNEVIEIMFENYAHFWAEHVEKEIPPEPSCYKDVKMLFQEPVGTIIADERIEQLSDEYKNIIQEVKRMDKRKDEIKTFVLEYARENSEGENFCIDKDTTEKLIIRSTAGRKLHSYNGKVFR